ncbi:MAG: tetratricopeptide repeat protein [Bacteroidota bacterium]
MAKKISKSTPATAVATAPAKAVGDPALTLLSFRVQAFIIIVLGLVFYANTFSHQAAFDDRMAITSNEYVQRGVAGIPDILTHDAFQSYLEQRNGGNQLAGGRYRPLSLITFAIEQQFLGVNDEVDNSIATGRGASDAQEGKIAQQMPPRHVVNVLLYILSAVVLLHFFRKIIFPGNELAAFCAALLFLIHPIHTEVVANVKSRDEILSVLFIALTFIKLFAYIDTRKRSALVWSLVYFFLALLSKEYAITLVVLLPLSIYIFRQQSATVSAKAFIPYLLPLALYFLLRFAAVSGPAEGAEQNIMNNPYLYATGAQKIATQITVLLTYIKLLVWPYTLAADYSYSQIPYTGFADVIVWLSLIVHLLIASVMIIAIRKRHIIGFAIAIYLLNLLLVSNLFFNIGAPMGERLIYHSSVGFAIALAWLIFKAVAKTQPSARIRLAGALMAVLVILSAFKVVNRNKDWENDTTLFLADVQTVSNSILVNNNAAAACMANAKKGMSKPERDEWFRKAIAYFNVALSKHPDYTHARLNRGLCYFNMGEPDKALPDWDTVRRQEPANQKVQYYFSVLGKYYFSQGMRYGRENKADSAVMAFTKGTMVDPNAADMWYNLGYAHFNARSYDQASKALERSLQLRPGNSSATQLYNQVRSMAATRH